jgi:hypothetical protein
VSVGDCCGQFWAHADSVVAVIMLPASKWALWAFDGAVPVQSFMCWDNMKSAAQRWLSEFECHR